MFGDDRSKWQKKEKENAEKNVQSIFNSAESCRRRSPSQVQSRMSASRQDSSVLPPADSSMVVVPRSKESFKRICRAIAGIIPDTLYRILYTPLLRIPDIMDRVNDTRYKALYKLI